MSELFAPLALALLFVVFGLVRRGRAAGGCGGACAGSGACQRGGECPRE